MGNKYMTQAEINIIRKQFIDYYDTCLCMGSIDEDGCVFIDGDRV